MCFCHGYCVCLSQILGTLIPNTLYLLTLAACEDSRDACLCVTATPLGHGVPSSHWPVCLLLGGGGSRGGKSQGRHCDAALHTYLSQVSLRPEVFKENTSPLSFWPQTPPTPQSSSVRSLPLPPPFTPLSLQPKMS